MAIERKTMGNTPMKRIVIFAMLLLVILGLGCTPMSSKTIPNVWIESIRITENNTINASAAINYHNGEINSYEILLTTIDPSLCRKIIQQFDPYLSMPSSETIATGFFIDKHDNQVEIEYYSNYLYLQKGESGTVQLEEWVLAGDAYPGEPEGTKLENVLITQEDAIASVDTFLDNIDLIDFVFAETKKCRILTDQYETVCEGWYITYLRNYHNYEPLDYFLYEPYGPIRLQRTKQTAPWMQEQLSFVITENGCQVFQWNAPSKIISKKRVDDRLADFNTIQRALCTELKNGYDWSRTTLSEDEIPYLYEMRLTWAMQHSSSDKDIAIITPMWACLFMSPKYEREHMRPFVICIDAITGKRIDPLFVQ